MITVIEGTNRNGSKTEEIANICCDILSDISDQKIALLKLSELKDFTIHGDMYMSDKQAPSVRKVQEEMIKPAEKWVIVLPEYNGGMPGIFKLFIDAISIREKDENFKGKKVCLIGVAAGRAGNLRGLDDITNYFHYLGTNVFYRKLPLSQIGNIMEGDQLIPDAHKGLVDLLQEFDKY